MFLRVLQTNPSDLYSVVFLCGAAGDLKIGTGIKQAICSALNCTLKTLSAAYNEVAEKGNGDIGDAAEIVSIRSKGQTTLFGAGKKKQLPLLVRDIVQTLASVQSLTGEGSRAARLQKITQMLRRCDVDAAAVNSGALTRPEVRFLVRTCVCNLRIHSSHVTILSAVARAAATFEHLQQQQQQQKSSAGVLLVVPAAASSSSPTPTPTPTMLAAAEDLLRQKYAMFQNLPTLLDIVAQEGLSGLHRLGVQVMTAVDPMLAKPATSIEEVLACGAGCNLLLEYKYDGVRAQIHLSRKPLVAGASSSVDKKEEDQEGVTRSSTTSLYDEKCYSRHLSDVTIKYEKGIKFLVSSLVAPVKNVIVDAEIVYVQGKGKDRRIQPFQKLTSAGSSSSNNVAEGNICVVLFDILLHNDVSCLDQPLNLRRELLRKLFREHPGMCEMAESVSIYCPALGEEEEEEEASHDVVDKTLKSAVSSGCEGLMVKMLTKKGAPKIRREIMEEIIEEDEFGFPVTKRRVVLSNGSGSGSSSSTKQQSSSSKNSRKNKRVAMEMLTPLYFVGKRSDEWRKLKIDYIDGAGVCDSIDVVPIGGWRGSGRKSKWYSPILVAIYNKRDGTFESLCRVMSGFTDVEYQRIKDSMVVVPTKPNNVITNEQPKFWFQQQEVWEIRGADITISPVHCASQGLQRGESNSDDLKGLSLRFPRFRTLRKDKSIEDATSSIQLVEMFLQQRT